MNILSGKEREIIFYLVSILNKKMRIGTYFIKSVHIRLGNNQTAE